MLERSRLESKKISKTNAVTSQLDYDIGSANVHIGPSDYVEWLTDRKWAYIRMEGTTFGDVPLNAELKLEVWDSPNSAGVIIDAIRCCKLALDAGLSGAMEAPSSYFMKSPPVQVFDDEARNSVEEYIVKCVALRKERGGMKAPARKAKKRIVKKAAKKTTKKKVAKKTTKKKTARKTTRRTRKK
jgi:myo-inositol-1-phosphate synthase